MKRILCVCYGNTCRSPMFQALLSQELKSRGIEAAVESAGVLDGTEAPANEKAIICMKEMGLDITDHLSRGISNLDLSAYDKIVCLTNMAAPLLIGRGALPEKVNIIEINNPYGKDLEAYRACADALTLVATKIASKL